MFGRSKKKKSVDAPLPPLGIAEIILCVFDDKQQVLYRFVSVRDPDHGDNLFRFLNDPEHSLDRWFMAEAVASRKPVSVSLSYDGGRCKSLYVLPYEKRRGRLRFACLQLAMERPDADVGLPQSAQNLASERVCLLMADNHGMVCSVSSTLPEAFGYSPETLLGMNLSDLFGAADLGMIQSCSSDTNESILSCIFHCLDGSRRDVEVRKYSATDDCTLYVVCDVTRRQLNEEIAQVSMRERRRIGQDLHDSIGQIVTGISLLSRSLANGLKRDGHEGNEDALQISELADDASNQIRQISRGLMPADIVHRGLYVSLGDLARVMQNSSGMECKVHLDQTVRFGDGAVETHLYRIAQEAVNNAIRHSGATRIDIVATGRNGLPELMIIDNGRWRDTAESDGGIGMKTMHYRASVINGLLDVRKNEHGGTSVVCRIEVNELMETKA